MTTGPAAPAPSRRLAVLFCAAVLGVLAAVGLVVGSVGGWPAAVGYTVLAVVLLGVAVARGRAAQRAGARRRNGRTCTCCTTTVADPVQVI